MNSYRSIVIFLFIILIAAAFWGATRYFNILKEEQRPSSPIPRQNQTAITIRITAQGFNPGNVEIVKGESVLFINNDIPPHWPASNVHPFHTICPGFDALHGLKTGEQYRITFIKSQRCPFHDHLNPSLAGIIIIR